MAEVPLRPAFEDTPRGVLTLPPALAAFCDTPVRLHSAEFDEQPLR